MPIFRPHEYQGRAIEHICRHKGCALWLDMGLGKTAVTLCAVKELLDSLEANRVLIIAPKSVAVNTWTAELDKWDNLDGLTISVAVGTAAQRRRAIAAAADITVINRENTEWLTEEYPGPAWPFDTVVLDEASSFKSPSSRRFKALRRVRPYIRRLIELTGTPSPNGLMDLWAQAYLLDFGQRLGRTLTGYRREFFKPGRGCGHVVYDWNPVSGAADIITKRMSDICLSMSAADYLTLPPRIDIRKGIVLTPKERDMYKAFERDCIINVSETEMVTAQQAAVLANKLLQFTGGGIYDEDGAYHPVSDEKLEALEETVETAGEPVLVFYGYTGERERIAQRLSGYRPVHFSGEPEILRRWNNGEIQVLLAHPASVAYGLNMQQGGHIIIWYTPTWNLELYQQANARLFRQGQEKPVRVIHLVAEGTIDCRVMDALTGKGDLQNYVMEQVRLIRGEIAG